jgi:hypothetical protein
MREDESEVAEARRRQARAEILERGRIMQERRRRKQAGNSVSDSSQTFERVVDNDGKLRKDGAVQATSSAVEPTPASNGGLQGQDLHESVDSGISLSQLSPRPVTDGADAVTFTSRYEQEMRNAWNLPLLETDRTALSSHASESLIDFTPTSEFPPDPEVLVPDNRGSNHEVNGSQYFSAAAAASTAPNTLSNDEPEFYYAHPSNPTQPIPSGPQQSARSDLPVSVSSAPSIAGSIDHVHASDVEASDDGVMSELGDGIQTPGSAWTDVESVVSDLE